MRQNLHIQLARTLLRSAEAHKQDDMVLDELVGIEKLLKDDEFRRHLHALSRGDIETIQSILQKAFEGISDVLLRFLAFILSHRLFSLFPSVIRSYKKTYFEKHGIRDIRIVTARELSSDEKKKASSQFETLLSGKTYLTFDIDSDIIAGIQIFENSTLTDYSSRALLMKIRKELSLRTYP
ncbi:ATP synthase F1 subunit delta [Candidatus Peregrinibacteria bacterium]|nr:ATP synthase F1 subunit delta [Candidatus Peregrinibacteria bacterium]